MPPEPSQAVAINAGTEYVNVCHAVASRLLRAISDGATYGVLAAELDIPKGTLYDYATRRRKPTPERASRILAWRYHRDSPHYRLTHPCPTCGEVHAIDDCHGQPGTVAWRKPPQDTRKRRRTDTTKYKNLTNDDIHRILTAANKRKESER